VPKNFITSQQAADKFGVTRRYINKLCSEGKVIGAEMFGAAWMVPRSFKWTPQKPGPKPKGK
jgi:hypothetical protein